MSLPDPQPPRKLSRLGVYAPMAIFVVLAIGWTAFWIWNRAETGRQMDATAAELRKAGYQISWASRGIGGYPFRLNVTLTGFRASEPAGWAVEAPRLESQAYMHAPGQWIIAATEGATFVRPVGGPVAVRGKLIRASLGSLKRYPPSFSFEGVELTFQPAPGAQPFGLASAERLEFHTRAGPDDEGGIFAEVKGGKAAPGGLMAALAGDKPVVFEWNSTLSKMSALTGADWPSAVRAWSAAGGRMTVRRAGLTAGDAAIGVSAGTLGADSGGRLSGLLDVTLRQAPRALAVMGATGLIPPEAAAAGAVVIAARQGTAQAARATINFQAGQTTLGPVALGPAPAVYAGR